jgi:hypothetical protein
MGSLMTLAAYGAGLVATLVLAAFLTPRSWWRRANARALAVLAGGTLAIGGALAWMLAPAMAAQAAQAAPMAAPLVLKDAPAAGGHYRVYDHLNLRSSRTVGARRIATIPAGDVVTATGAHAGDWWEINASIDGAPVTGWASSLWLRRLDEKRR